MKAQVCIGKNIQRSVVQLINPQERRKLGELDSWMIDFDAVYSAKSNVPGLRVPMVWCVRGFSYSQYKQMIRTFKRRLDSELITTAEIVEMWAPMSLSLAVAITEFNKQIESERAEYERSNAGNQDTAEACTAAEKAY